MSTIIIIKEKEGRKCSICRQEGHNKNKCPSAPAAPHPPPAAAPPPPAAAKITPVFWERGMFLRGGLMELPAAVAWKPGTNSIEYGAEMDRHPAYRYDKVSGWYLRK